MGETRLSSEEELYCEIDSLRAKLAAVDKQREDFFWDKQRAEAERDAAMNVVRWVETWVGQPVGAYSVYALDGLFGMTRDKIAALNPSPTVGGMEE